MLSVRTLLREVSSRLPTYVENVGSNDVIGGILNIMLLFRGKTYLLTYNIKLNKECQIVACLLKVWSLLERAKEKLEFNYHFKTIRGSFFLPVHIRLELG